MTTSVATRLKQVDTNTAASLNNSCDEEQLQKLAWLAYKIEQGKYVSDTVPGPEDTTIHEVKMAAYRAQDNGFAAWGQYYDQEESKEALGDSNG